MSTFSFDGRPQKLPPATQELLGPGLTAHSAYSLVRAHERNLIAHESPGDRDPRIIHLRVLGWMMIFSANDEMRAEMARAIVSCNDKLDQLVALGTFYRDHWIRTFKKIKGPTPRASGHISRPSFDTISLFVAHFLDPAPKDYQAAKQNALIRDGHRCMVTGRYDDTSYMKIQELHNELDADPNTSVGVVECAHIFARSTNTNFSDDVKRAYAGAAWTVLMRFGYSDFLEELNGADIHRLSNLLTLDKDIHSWFDNLWLWFEPLVSIPFNILGFISYFKTSQDDDPDSHRYKVQTTSSKLYERVPRTVTFFNRTPTDIAPLPMPNKRYLAMHAACAKVAHMSGAAEALDDLDRRYDEGTVLAWDGGSADLLHHRLSTLQRVEVI
ncbi:hypothetical protein HGRIS_000716 [Hohenbuehelia grisea]|uniref:HNH nuclease domain-containing protein n=1 Tax=Hohenbuehelia grisea TaxID=104357 RepID=A0ABR3JRT4_9AGAR